VGPSVLVPEHAAVVIRTPLATAALADAFVARYAAWMVARVLSRSPTESEKEGDPPRKSSHRPAPVVGADYRPGAGAPPQGVSLHFGAAAAAAQLSQPTRRGPGSDLLLRWCALQ
jgi:hypothetical protein